MGEKRTRSDYIEVVTQRPAELFEPILDGMLASIKEKEAERLRRHRERLGLKVTPPQTPQDQNPHLPGDSQTDQAGTVKEEPEESDRS
jgi:hypothetical protein